MRTNVHMKCLYSCAHVEIFYDDAFSLKISATFPSTHCDVSLVGMPQFQSEQHNQAGAER